MKLKKDLFDAFTPPEPKKKDAFINGISFPKLSFPQFVLEQISFIRKRIWAASAVMLLVGICVVCFMPEEYYSYNKYMGIWIISSLLPFLSMLTAAEISRSDIYGMAEIETGCKFSVPQLVGARLIILGVCSFIVIAAITVISGIFSPIGIIKSALFILSPYLAVSGVTLAIFRRFKGQDGVYISASAALAVSIAGFIFFSEQYNGFENLRVIISMLVCAAGVYETAVQVRKICNGDKNYGISY